MKARNWLAPMLLALPHVAHACGGPFPSGAGGPVEVLMYAAFFTGIVLVCPLVFVLALRQVVLFFWRREP